MDNAGVFAGFCPMPSYEMKTNDLTLDTWRAFWVSVAWDRAPCIAGLECVGGMGYHYPSLKDGEGGAWQHPDGAREIDDLSAIVLVPWADKSADTMARIPRPYLTPEQHRKLVSKWAQARVECTTGWQRGLPETLSIG